MDLNETVRRMMMAGLGAVSFTVEKSKELAEALIRKGEQTASDKEGDCQKFCDQLAGQLREFSEKVKADIDRASFEELLSRVDDLTDEQRAVLLERLTQPRPEPAAQPDGACDCDAESCECDAESCECDDKSCCCDAETADAPATEDGGDKPE